jgi:hypothetical protein
MMGFSRKHENPTDNESGYHSLADALNLHPAGQRFLPQRRQVYTLSSSTLRCKDAVPNV